MTAHKSRASSCWRVHARVHLCGADLEGRGRQTISYKMLEEVLSPSPANILITAIFWELPLGKATVVFS